MYMRFGNLLNELLFEHRLNGNPFYNTGDLTLSVADDSPDFYVFTVSSYKYRKILGTITITTTLTNDDQDNKVKSEAYVDYKFQKVPNRETMLMALGTIPQAILDYISSITDPEGYPGLIRFEPKTPVEGRYFSSRDFDSVLYHILFSNFNYNRDSQEYNPMSNYYRSYSTTKGFVLRHRDMY